MTVPEEAYNVPLRFRSLPVSPSASTQQPPMYLTIVVVVVVSVDSNLAL